MMARQQHKSAAAAAPAPEVAKLTMRLDSLEQELAALYASLTEAEGVGGEAGGGGEIPLFSPRSGPSNLSSSMAAREKRWNVAHLSASRRASGAEGSGEGDALGTVETARRFPTHHIARAVLAPERANAELAGLVRKGVEKEGRGSRLALILPQSAHCLKPHP